VCAASVVYRLRSKIAFIAGEEGLKLGGGIPFPSALAVEKA